MADLTPDTPVEPDAPVADAPAPDAGPARVKGLHDATPDQLDAILRDPNVPGDVRAATVQHYSVASYLARSEFVTDNDGLTNVKARDANV